MSNKQRIHNNRGFRNIYSVIDQQLIIIYPLTKKLQIRVRN